MGGTGDTLNTETRYGRRIFPFKKATHRGVGGVRVCVLSEETGHRVLASGG